MFDAAVTAQFLTSRVLPRLAEMPNVPPLTDRPPGDAHDDADHIVSGSQVGDRYTSRYGSPVGDDFRD